MMVYFYRNFKFLILICFLFGCGDRSEIHLEEVPVQGGSDRPGVADIDSGHEAYNFGITPSDNPDEMRARYLPLLAYLSDQLGKKIRAVVAGDYNQLRRDLLAGVVDIAAFTPGVYAESLEEGKGDAIYVVTAKRGEKEFYQGVILVQTNSPYQKLGDLRGKKIGFVERGSSSGYKYPVAALLRQDVCPESFFGAGNIFFLGSHTNVLEGVIGGTVDVGATYDGKYEQAPEAQKKSLRVIARTPPIPFDAYVVSSKTGAAVAQKLQKILVSITPETKNKNGELVLDAARKFPYTGFVVRNPAFYDVVRYTSRAVKDYEKTRCR